MQAESSPQPAAAEENEALSVMRYVLPDALSHGVVD